MPIFPAGSLFLLIFTLVSCSLPAIPVRARLLPRTHYIGGRATSASDGGLSSASWIWTSGSHGAANTAAGNVAFLKTFNSPTGKTASSAVISMAAADHFTLWVNGQPVGASGNTTDAWKSVQTLGAALNASVNVFSVLAVNNVGSAAPAPGLVAAIQISYTDNTTATVLTDASWLAASSIPSDFPNPSDTSYFAPSAVAAPFGSGPWGQSVILPSAEADPLNLTDSEWIWSIPNANYTAPVGTIGFRKNFSTPTGKSARTATVLLTVDNSFVLYLNGAYVGAPPYDPNVVDTNAVWTYAQRFTVDLNSALNIFTVVAQNYPAVGSSVASSAGFVGAIQILYADGTSDIVRTDATWLNADFLSLSTFLAMDDSILVASAPQGPFGVGPWGELHGISDALNAASVPTAPFSSASVSLNPTAVAGPAKHSVAIGIILGVVLGVLGLVALTFGLLCWRKRRSAARSADSESTYNAPALMSQNSHNAISRAPTLTAFDSSVARGSLAVQVPLSVQLPAEKLDSAAVFQMNGGAHRDGPSQVEYADVPPPSYTFSTRGDLYEE
ncbi:hypothetical protein B0H10DRAFT_1952415 [Mycena sp. CBHHK59/15]|nr:hypothetical protein B0H10DRAFT_1952415 [Mycena sp. CBHHK59/15]